MIAAIERGAVTAGRALARVPTSAIAIGTTAVGATLMTAALEKGDDGVNIKRNGSNVFLAGFAAPIALSGSAMLISGAAGAMGHAAVANTAWRYSTGAMIGVFGGLGLQATVGTLGVMASY